MTLPLEHHLEELGLSKNEAKVYIALLQQGASSGGAIADATGIHRPNVYEALERLAMKGLARFVILEGVKKYDAAPPTALHDLVARKEDIVQSILPDLTSLHHLATNKNPVTLYEGVSSIKSMLYDFLTYKDEITVTQVPARAPELMKYFINAFHTERLKLKIPMRHIYDEDAKERIAFLNSLPYTGARYLPAKFSAPNSTLVCGDSVVIVLWNVQPLLFIRIRNQELAMAYKNYFEILWEKAGQLLGKDGTVASKK